MPFLFKNKMADTTLADNLNITKKFIYVISPQLMPCFNVFLTINKLSRRRIVPILLCNFSPAKNLFAKKIKNIFNLLPQQNF